jgi:hypothetical protein
VALAAGEPGAAQGHPLIKRHPVPDLGGLADHHPGTVVDEEVGADLRRGMDLDPGHRPARVCDGPGGERDLALPEGVGDPVGEQRLHPGPAGEDLESTDLVGGGVAVAGRSDVRGHLADHASERAKAEHQRERYSGAKKGSDI